MVTQRDTDKWLLSREVPEVTYEDEPFDLDANATVFMGNFLGSPLKTILQLESIEATVTKRFNVVAVIRRAVS